MTQGSGRRRSPFGGSPGGLLSGSGAQCSSHSEARDQGVSRTASRHQGAQDTAGHTLCDLCFPEATTQYGCGAPITTLPLLGTALSPSLLSPSLLAPLQGLDSHLRDLGRPNGVTGWWGGSLQTCRSPATCPTLTPVLVDLDLSVAHLSRMLDARRSSGWGGCLHPWGRVCPCSNPLMTLEVGDSGAPTRQPPLWSPQCCGEGPLPQGCSQTSHE